MYSFIQREGLGLVPKLLLCFLVLFPVENALCPKHYCIKFCKKRCVLYQIYFDWLIGWLIAWRTGDVQVCLSKSWKWRTYLTNLWRHFFGSPAWLIKTDTDFTSSSIQLNSINLYLYIAFQKGRKMGNVCVCVCVCVCVWESDIILTAEIEEGSNQHNSQTPQHSHQGPKYQRPTAWQDTHIQCF